MMLHAGCFEELIMKKLLCLLLTLLLTGCGGAAAPAAPQAPPSGTVGYVAFDDRPVELDPGV